MEIDCGNCSQKIEYGTEWLGRFGRCPNCGKAVEFPLASADVQHEAERGPLQAGMSGPGPAEACSRLKTLFGMISGGSVVAVAGIVGLFLSLKGRDASPATEKAHRVETHLESRANETLARSPAESKEEEAVGIPVKLDPKPHPKTKHPVSGKGGEWASLEGTWEEIRKVETVGGTDQDTSSRQSTFTLTHLGDGKFERRVRAVFSYPGINNDTEKSSSEYLSTLQLRKLEGNTFHVVSSDATGTNQMLRGSSEWSSTFREGSQVKRATDSYGNKTLTTLQNSSLDFKVVGRSLTISSRHSGGSIERWDQILHEVRSPEHERRIETVYQKKEIKGHSGSILYEKVD